MVFLPTTTAGGNRREIFSLNPPNRNAANTSNKCHTDRKFKSSANTGFVANWNFLVDYSGPFFGYVANEQRYIGSEQQHLGDRWTKSWGTAVRDGVLRPGCDQGVI